MVKGRNRQDDMLFDLVLHVIHDTLYVIRSKNTYYVCFDMFYVWCRITNDHRLHAGVSIFCFLVEPDALWAD